jgi:hypothetical protein
MSIPDLSDPQNLLPMAAGYLRINQQLVCVEGSFRTAKFRHKKSSFFLVAILTLLVVNILDTLPIEARCQLSCLI